MAWINLAYVAITVAGMYWLLTTKGVDRVVPFDPELAQRAGYAAGAYYVVAQAVVLAVILLKRRAASHAV